MEIKVFILAVLLSVAGCLPLDEDGNDIASSGTEHGLWKRFIDPSVIDGDFAGNAISNIRTKRSLEDECERLQLCKLHARSRYNFFAAYELYFVNKENAKLWDHRAHSVADCERRFGGCYS